MQSKADDVQSYRTGKEDKRKDGKKSEIPILGEKRKIRIYNTIARLPARPGCAYTSIRLLPSTFPSFPTTTTTATATRTEHVMNDTCSAYINIRNPPRTKK